MDPKVCLEALFNNSVFHIPQYQRAYAWEKDPHLAAFLDDLRQQVSALDTGSMKSYFLGTLLLHRKQRKGSDGFDNFDIVDGQQRLTTSVVFVATALDLASKELVSLAPTEVRILKRKFLKDDDADCHKFHTIAEDEPFFRSSITKTAPTSGIKPTRRSQKLMDNAMKYFKEAVNRAEWPDLLRVLRQSHVLVYEVDNSADATQIFELQNDRGKRLTSLEALKSFLMHTIYVYAQNHEDRLSAIQVQFADIYRTVEELESINRAPDEDAILSYHCVAFTDWKNDDYRNPKKLAKSFITELNKADNETSIVAWIEDFVQSLVATFVSVKSILDSRDRLPEFSNLFILGRLAPFWPLVIKTWRYAQNISSITSFETACKLMEIYAFRGYGISNMRSDSGQTTLYSKARDFHGDFQKLVNELKDMCKWYDLERRFEAGLQNPKIYETDGPDVLYLLWRYENHLRRKTGQQHHQLSWRDYLESKDEASKFCIEHIFPKGSPLVDQMVEWELGQPTIPFSEVALNRLGNLVLDSKSPNSAKGKETFSNKLPHFANVSIYMSQKELFRFVNDRDDKNNPVWGLSAIKKRHAELVKFAQDAWDFRKVSLPGDGNN